MFSSTHPTGKLRFVSRDGRNILQQIQHDQCFGKESWRMPAMQQTRIESMAKQVLMLVREIRSLRKQVDAKKGK